MISSCCVPFLRESDVHAKYDLRCQGVSAVIAQPILFTHVRHCSLLDDRAEHITASRHCSTIPWCSRHLRRRLASTMPMPMNVVHPLRCVAGLLSVEVRSTGQVPSDFGSPAVGIMRGMFSMKPPPVMWATPFHVRGLEQRRASDVDLGGGEQLRPGFSPARPEFGVHGVLLLEHLADQGEAIWVEAGGGQASSIAFRHGRNRPRWRPFPTPTVNPPDRSHLRRTCRGFGGFAADSAGFRPVHSRPPRRPRWYQTPGRSCRRRCSQENNGSAPWAAMSLTHMATRSRCRWCRAYWPWRP